MVGLRLLGTVGKLLDAIVRKAQVNGAPSLPSLYLKTPDYQIIARSKINSASKWRVIATFSPVVSSSQT